MKKWVKCLLIVLAIILFGGLCLPTGFAIGTHLWFGHRPAVNGFVIPAPWNLMIVRGYEQVTLLSVPNSIRDSYLGQRNGIGYTFSVPKGRPFNYDRDHPAVERMLQQSGQPFHFRMIEIVHIRHYCYETPKREDAREVYCMPEGNGLDVFFSGPTERVTEFYSLVATIERQKD